MTQRDAFFNRLFDIAKDNPDVFLISADMGAPSLDRFRKELPNQYIDAGIAEQNAVLLASGMALKGKKVFVYAIAPFVTYRVVEQIRLELGACNLPVTIVGVGAGMSYDDSGPTHHTVEDIGILRTIPNLRIHNMTDAVMAEAFVDISVGLDYPNYIRLDRQENPDVYTNGEFMEDDGYAMTNASAGDVDILTTGSMVYTAREIAGVLEKRGKDVRVADFFEFPLTSGYFGEISNDPPKKIVTIEEHVLPCGLGSAVLEKLSDFGMLIPVERFGLDFSKGYCYQYGGRKELLKSCGLDKETILKQLEKWI